VSKITRILEKIHTYKYIAIDQYGNIVWIRENPRKELMEHCGVKWAEKMYFDTKEYIDNKKLTYHIGYVVAKKWFHVYGIEGNRFFKVVK